MTIIKTDVCVIGAGSAGLSVAAGAVQMGSKVVLIEQGKMGGDCLNYGCVPSKSLLAAAKHARNMRIADQFGIENHDPQIDYAKVRDHIRGVIATIAPHDSVERFESLGVTVLRESARFMSAQEVVVGQQRVKSKYFVIATGSSPAVPPLPGLDEISFLTNETIFDLDKCPDHLIIIGGGPIGCEMAQAHLLLGARVTVLEMFSIMPKDDSELVNVVRQCLLSDGLNLHEKVKVSKVESTNSGVVVTIENDQGVERVEGSHILIATGRKPNVADLDLEKAGVVYTTKGVQVSRRLRSSQKRIFAVGDVAGSYQFTHTANYHAGIVLRNILFHMPAKVDYRAMPWVTYTIPELAHVGMNETIAQKAKVKYKILRTHFTEIDRSQVEHEIEGLIKVLVTPRGKILGVSIVGAQAGELITPWALALNKKLKIGALANIIVPYPTRSEITKRVAVEFYIPKLFSKQIKRVVRFLGRF